MWRQIKYLLVCCIARKNINGEDLFYRQDFCFVTSIDLHCTTSFKKFKWRENIFTMCRNGRRESVYVMAGLRQLLKDSLANLINYSWPIAYSESIALSHIVTAFLSLYFNL
jgi:hypothetical protein